MQVAYFGKFIPTKERFCNGEQRYIFDLENGLLASVIYQPTNREPQERYALAILDKKGRLRHDTPLEDDVFTCATSQEIIEQLSMLCDLEVIQ